MTSSGRQVGLALLYSCIAYGPMVARSRHRTEGHRATRLREERRRSGSVFYSVELQCPLVTRLGCGTESKPIMRKLDSHQAVAGTWLNHAGNKLAVLWNQKADAAQRSEALAVAFQNQTGPTELQGSSRDAALRDFLSGVAWYRTSALMFAERAEKVILPARGLDRLRLSPAV